MSTSVTSGLRTSISSARSSACALARAHRAGQRVAVDGEDGDARAGQRDRVAADAAAQVRRDGADAERLKDAARYVATPVLVACLDAVRREVHAGRVLRPELRHRPLPQPGLGERRRDEPGRVLAAQPGGEREFLRGVVVAQLVERGATSGDSRAEKPAGSAGSAGSEKALTRTIAPVGGWCAPRGGVGPLNRAVSCEDRRHATSTTKRRNRYEGDTGTGRTAGGRRVAAAALVAAALATGRAAGGDDAVAGLGQQ